MTKFNYQGLQRQAGPGVGVNSQPSGQVVQPSIDVLQTSLVAVQLLVQQAEPQEDSREPEICSY